MTSDSLRIASASDHWSGPPMRQCNPGPIWRGQQYSDLHPPLLEGLTSVQRLAFFADCTPRRYATQTEVLTQDEEAPAAYLIAEGRIEVTFVDSDGNTVIAHVAQPGEVMGDIELLSGKTCAATCRTHANTTLLSFGLSLMMKHIPAEILLRNFAGILHGRLIRDNRMQSIAQFYPAEARICMHLLNLTSDDRPQVQLSQAQLALLAGCSRQTVNRTLADLRMRGAIELGRGTIRLLDARRLTSGPAT